MKKLALCLWALMSVVLWSCSDNDDPKAEVTVSFEDKLTGAETEYKSDNPANAEMQSAEITDSKNLVTLYHYYTNWGYEGTYNFSGMTYTKKTSGSDAAACGKGKFGNVYISVYENESYGAPAQFKWNTTAYLLKGVWITTSESAYTAMTEGDSYGAKPYKKGSYYKVEAIGLDAGGQEINGAKTEIYLANYKSDDDKPVKDWIWFDLSMLGNASSVKFKPSCSDNNDWGMVTSRYFCLDGITLVER